MAAKLIGVTYGWCWWGVIILLMILAPVPAVATTFLYKQYVIQQDRGQDILCEPYQVQKNDWVYKIFRRKGEIAEDDFPHFLQIFQRLNPHITDLDRIQVGDRILIPLKKIEAGETPPDGQSEAQSAGLVNIPFVTISQGTGEPSADMGTGLGSQPRPYQVKAGDTVHRLIATQFGPRGSPGFEPALTRFKELNPEIENLNRIFVGQVIQLPTKALLESSGALAEVPPSQEPPNSAITDPSPSEPSIMELKPPPKPVPAAPALPEAPLDAMATLLGGSFKNKGKFHFPTSDGDDVVIDVARTPFLELAPGRRMLILNGPPMPAADLAAVRKFWPDLKVLSLDNQTSVADQLGRLLKAYGAVQAPPHMTVKEPGLTLTLRTNYLLTPKPVGAALPNNPRIGLTLLTDLAEQTPPAIGRYLAEHGITLYEIVARDTRLQVLKFDLKSRPTVPVRSLPVADRRKLVTELIQIMGFACVPNSQITFPYAGMELSAWVDLVQNADGEDFVLNFGQIQGEAVGVIEESGLRVVDLPHRAALRENLLTLFQALDISSTVDPVFWAATRPATYNISITATGLLASPLIGRKFLITPFHLSVTALQIFQERGIQVVQLAMTPRQRKAAGWG